MGGRVPPPLAVTSAPSSRSGRTTRAIGRCLSEASPVSTARPGSPERRPLRRRMVVPEFSQSSTSAGSPSPERPRPRTSSAPPPGPVPGISSTSVPRARRQASVARVSAASRKCSTRDSPSASAPSMSARCVIDLSPGTETLPWRRANGRTVRPSPIGSGSPGAAPERPHRRRRARGSLPSSWPSRHSRILSESAPPSRRSNADIDGILLCDSVQASRPTSPAASRA